MANQWLHIAIIDANFIKENKTPRWPLKLALKCQLGHYSEVGCMNNNFLWFWGSDFQINNCQTANVINWYKFHQQKSKMESEIGAKMSA